MSSETSTWLLGLIATALVVALWLFLSTWLATGISTGAWAHLDSGIFGHYCSRLVQGNSPLEAWRSVTPAAPVVPVLVGVATLLAGVVAVTILVLRRTFGPQRHANDNARWATRADERRMVVSGRAVRRHHRLIAGRSTATGRFLAADDCVSAVVFGPNGSGKTVGLIIPNTLEWAGSVVMTTAKPQDLTPVLHARRGRGPVWVVAPGGAPGVETAAWSPVDYAADADSADRMAGWLVDSSGMTEDARARPWNAQARKYLKGLLLAAHVSGRGTKGFVEWAYEGELASDHVSQVLSEHGYFEVMREYRSTWRIHEEGKGSVMFTAYGLADTYNRPGVLRSADHSDFTARDLFGEHPATVLLVTPQSEVERFTPYFTALISSLVHEAEQQAAQTGGPVNPRLLLALDEAGNVFRYPRLPHLLTTARGNGVQLLLAYHDVAQIEHLFGGRDVGRTILSNAKLRILLPGVGDIETLRYFSELLGRTTRPSRSRQVSADGRRTTSEVDQQQPLASVDALQRLADGQAVVLYENLPPAKVRLRRWFEDRDLRRLGGMTSRWSGGENR